MGGRRWISAATAAVISICAAGAPAVATTTKPALSATEMQESVPDTVAPVLESAMLERETIRPGETAVLHWRTRDASGQLPPEFTADVPRGLAITTRILSTDDGVIEGVTEFQSDEQTSGYGLYTPVVVLSDEHGNHSSEYIYAAQFSIEDPEHPEGTVWVSGHLMVRNTIKSRDDSYWAAEATLTHEWSRPGGPPLATGPSLVLDDSWIGSRVQLTVTGTWPDGTVRVRTMTTPSAVMHNPEDLVAGTPTYTGTVAVGQTLTGHVGAWSPFATLTYWWERDDGAVREWGNTITLHPEDLGHTFRFIVDGSATGYIARGDEVATAPVKPGTATVPRLWVAGIPRVGETLLVSYGTWHRDTELRYQWLRNGKSIAGATADRYALTPADLGQRLSYRITGTNFAYTTASGVSPQSAVIAMGVLNTGRPSISGTLRAGYTLTANTGMWTPGATLKYQWYRLGQPIDGANARTYSLTGKDADTTLTVKVTGSKIGYSSASKTTVDTARIAKGMLTSRTPAIGGTTKVGSTLTAKTGTWTSGTKFKYKWYRSGKAIKGADTKIYKLTKLDRSRTIKVRVTGYQTGFHTKSRYSDSTARIS